MAQVEIMARQDVPPEMRWNDKAVFASWDEWQREAEAIRSALPGLAAFEGRLAEGPLILADWLELATSLHRRLLRLFVYAHMFNVVDANDTVAKERMGQLMGLYAQFRAKSAFAEPALLQIGDTLLSWAESESRLAIYDHYFDNLLRQQEHRRSAEVEEVLALALEHFSQVEKTYDELTNLDLKFAAALDSAGQIHPVVQAAQPPSNIQDADRALRRSSWESYSDGYVSVQNTLASNYIAHVKQSVFLTRVRGYASVLEAQLAPYHLPVDVFHTLIDSFKAHIATWHRYWEVKRRFLGVAELHPYDIWAPIVADPPSVPFHQAVDMISEGLVPLGEAYVAVLRRGCLEGGWVDYAPNLGKAQGAASMMSVDTPPFIFTSHDDSISAMSTLSHELGHSMHSYLIDSTQPHIYNNRVTFSLAAAETASNLHQALVRAHLMQTRSNDTVFLLALLDEAMENFHRYFFIMPTLARFEFEVYSRAEQGRPLSAAIFNELMADLFAEGYGDTMVDDRQRTAITWAQFGHLYMPYYTFQYSIGISAAHAIADRILNGPDNGVEAYLQFLKAGSSLYTLDLFALAGLDITKPDMVEQAFSVLSDLVDRLESLAPAA